MFLFSWFGPLLIRAGYPRLASILAPLLWVLGAGLLGLFVWWRVDTWHDQIYKQARIEITEELNKAYDARMAELTVQIKAFADDSARRGTKLDAQQAAFANTTKSLMAQIKTKPIIGLNADGECRVITPEASKTWNQLQKQLQQ